MRNPSQQDLGQVPLLATLDEQQRARLATHLEVNEAASGDQLLRQGDLARTFSILADGAAQVTVGELVVGWLYRHDFFGEIALLGERRRMATVTALEPCVTWDMDRRTFQRLQQDHPEIAATIEQAAAERQQTDARMRVR